MHNISHPTRKIKTRGVVMADGVGGFTAVVELGHEARDGAESLELEVQCLIRSLLIRTIRIKVVSRGSFLSNYIQGYP